jgi:hypothetical protein
MAGDDVAVLVGVDARASKVVGGQAIGIGGRVARVVERIIVACAQAVVCSNCRRIDDLLIRRTDKEVW